jgi:hypothetical protein
MTDLSLLYEYVRKRKRVPGIVTGAFRGWDEMPANSFTMDIRIF